MASIMSRSGWLDSNAGYDNDSDGDDDDAGDDALAASILMLVPGAGGGCCCFNRRRCRCSHQQPPAAAPSNNQQQPKAPRSIHTPAATTTSSHQQPAAAAPSNNQATAADRVTAEGQHPESTVSARDTLACACNAQACSTQLDGSHANTYSQIHKST